MFPYFWGGVPMNDAGGMTFSTLLSKDLGLDQLPEEVREALETRREDIRTEDDVRRIVEEERLKR